MTHSSTSELSPVLESIVTTWSRERERREVEETMNIANAGGRAILGPDACLRLLQQGRVSHLYYASNLALTGWRLPDGSLTLSTAADAPERRKEEPHLVERMVEMAFETGADVTPVEGEAAERLMDMGGMEARLRY
jgi:hypothetical protein